MAALITSSNGVEAEVLEGNRGEFSVWVGESRVAQKTREGFPEDDEIVAAVSRALARP